MSSQAKQVVNVATPVVKRDVNKWLYRIRQFLMLRDFTPNQRHEFEWSRRTQPLPYLPSGFAHKLNKNYYYDRDARRQVAPPQVLFSTSATNAALLGGSSQPQLAAGGAPAPGNAPPVTSSETPTLVSIIEAEKQTAALLAAVNTNQQKKSVIGRTPGKVYNWDG